MDQVNLKKLAKELNLAVSTVSRALRDSHEISPQTKERVRALAEKWGFQPNPHASSLRQNKSRTIAVIIPEIENNFFSQVINGIESMAPEKGYMCSSISPTKITTVNATPYSCCAMAG